MLPGATRCVALGLHIVGAMLVVAPAPAADVSLLAGGGIYRYTHGFALQVSVSTPTLKNARAYYTRWSDNSALVGAYEFRFGPINFSPGAGYLSSSTPDIARRLIFQFELGWQFTERIRCQLTHLSSPPHDHGENMALCGIRFTVSGR
jgi:hypothetical protein